MHDVIVLYHLNKSSEEIAKELNLSLAHVKEIVEDILKKSNKEKLKTKGVNMKIKKIKESYIQLVGPFNIPKSQDIIQTIADKWNVKFDKENGKLFTQDDSALKKNLNTILGELKLLGMGYKMVESFKEKLKKLKEEFKDKKGKIIKKGDFVDSPIGDGEVIRFANDLVDVKFSDGTIKNYKSKEIEVTESFKEGFKASNNLISKIKQKGRELKLDDWQIKKAIEYVEFHWGSEKEVLENFEDEKKFNWFMSSIKKEYRK